MNFEPAIPETKVLAIASHVGFRLFLIGLADKYGLRWCMGESNNLNTLDGLEAGSDLTVKDTSVTRWPPLLCRL